MSQLSSMSQEEDQVCYGAAPHYFFLLKRSDNRIKLIIDNLTSTS